MRKEKQIKTKEVFINLNVSNKGGRMKIKYRLDCYKDSRLPRYVEMIEGTSKQLDRAVKKLTTKGFNVVIKKLYKEEQMKKEQVKKTQTTKVVKTEKPDINLIRRKIMKKKRPIKYLNEQELHKFFETVKKKGNVRNELLFKLIFHLGLRVSEALSLKLKDFHSKLIEVKVERLKNRIRWKKLSIKVAESFSV